MTKENREKQLELYNNALETASIRNIEAARERIETSINERRRTYAEDYTIMIQALVNTMMIEFNRMFPGARAFIEGRIKSNNSIALKLTNKFQKAMNEPNFEKMNKAIEQINLTDILALSVVVTDVPKRFRTTDDKLNDKLNELSKRLEKTENRLKKHRKHIEDNEKKLRRVEEEFDELKQIRIARGKKGGIVDKIAEAIEKAHIEDLAIIAELDNMLQESILQTIQEKALNEKRATAEEDIKYGQENLFRTQETYDRELLDLQREMAYYFVSNLSKCQSLKMFDTSQIESPELKSKPGFIATTAKYMSSFTNMANTEKKNNIIYEVQGKGEEDWRSAEFGRGALYHENQKTEEGQYSKQTNLPDFTIIGKNTTDEIEKDVKNEYRKLDFKDLLQKSKSDLQQWFKENGSIDKKLIEEEIARLRKYIKSIQDKMQEKTTIVVNGISMNIDKNADEYDRYRDILEKTAEVKIDEAYESARNHIIQGEIDRRIDLRIGEKADETNFVNSINDKSSELNAIYTSELEKLKNAKGNMTDEEVQHMARVRVLYRLKENEITKIAKDIVPIFFYANTTDDKDEKSMVFYRSTGEAIYRYYYNRLHGLKKGNDYEENLEPQEQQKRALLKLKGLFEEDEANFFVYDKKENLRVDLDER